MCEMARGGRVKMLAYLLFVEVTYIVWYARAGIFVLR